MSRRGLWFISTLASALLLAIVIAEIDLDQARAVLGGIDYRWLIAGLALLQVEGLITAARLRLLAQRGATYADCLRATAWYVLLLIGLPARLGEIAGVAVIVRTMRERAGTAAANLLFQRLFDLVLLLSVLALAATFVTAEGEAAIAAAVTICALMLAAMFWLGWILTLAARPLVPHRHRPWPRRVLRLLLQARIVRRHYLTRRRATALALYTVAKWGVNLGGIACVVTAVLPLIAMPTALGVGIVYNLAAVIPLQTVGGFGVSEIVLLGSFRWLGYDPGIGAPVAIAVRLALLSAPLLFWATVVAIGSLRRAHPKARRPGSAGAG